MKPIIIKAAVSEGKPAAEFPGWIVPDTDGLLAIDMRYEGHWDAEMPDPSEWFVTHLPSGYSVRYGHYTLATHSDTAIDIAQRFYQQCKVHGFDLTSTDPAAIVAPFKKLRPSEHVTFWELVAGGKRNGSDSKPDEAKSSNG